MDPDPPCCLLPADVTLELNPAPDAKEVLYDEATKTVRIPLAAVNDGQRRTKMVMFTCNKCGEPRTRKVWRHAVQTVAAVSEPTTAVKWA